MRHDVLIECYSRDVAHTLVFCNSEFEASTVFSLANTLEDLILVVYATDDEVAECDLVAVYTYEQWIGERNEQLLSVCN